MADVINFWGVALAVAISLYTYWYVWKTGRRIGTASRVEKTSSPQAALIEIIEKGRATDSTTGGSVIVPNDVRINGQPLLVPKETPIRVHEIDADDSTVVSVTLTLFARRVVIAAEDDL